MEREPLEFWFEFASTYSYPAAMRIEELAAEAKISIRWRPFLLGPIFAAQGWADSPFNLYPVKGRYMWRDLARLCEKYELPFRRPRMFPRSGLLAARVALWAAREPWCPSFVRAIYRANFAEDRDIARPEIVAEILASTTSSRAPNRPRTNYSCASKPTAPSRWEFSAPRPWWPARNYFGAMTGSRTRSTST
jgi:2-hydroxychromene-2-carboxylate isomerase